LNLFDVSYQYFEMQVSVQRPPCSGGQVKIGVDLSPPFSTGVARGEPGGFLENTVWDGVLEANRNIVQYTNLKTMLEKMAF
jgi:hypothetical protein